MPSNQPEPVELRNILEVTPLSGQRVLELGCGTGRLLHEVAGLAEQVIGLDTNTVSLTEAKFEAANNLQVVAADAVRLPLANECFDIVLFGWSL